MTEPNRQSGENEERIIEIEIERLRPFKEHPFQVKDDKEMFLLQESIEKYGILNPLIVRPVPDGYYEIISGHRRKYAAEKLGYRKVPVIIRVLSEDDSILSMVDSNLHRERISYSEKAFAYKLKNDVLKRKSGRKKSQVDHKTPRKRSIEIISEDCGDSPKQVQRYISLTKLIPEMLQKLDDEKMQDLVESVRINGVLTLVLLRMDDNEEYEMVSGHRRKHAAEKLGYRKVPVIIRVLSEDDSILSMVDSNLHRERISYSEKAFAYKLKNDVLKRKSGRKKSQVDHKTPRKRAIEIISEDCGDSPKQVQRYISLTKLIPEMLQKLDDEIISFCPAVEIAALSEKEQKELLVAMEYAQAIPSLSQAQRIRQMSKEKQLSLEKMEEIMCEVKKGEITRVAFTNEQLHKYFPNSYTPAMMKREILALLKLWKKESWES